MALKLMFAVMLTANLASIVTSQSDACYDDVANTDVLDKQVILRDARTICYCEKNRGYELGCRILTPNIEAVINAINIPCEDCPKKLVPKPQDPESKGYKKYGGMWLKIGTDKKPFFPALDACEQEGGHLVYAKNETDLNHIKDFLEDSESDESTLWVGAEDLLTEGSIKWLDGSSVQTSLFMYGAPDDTDGCVNSQGEVSVNYKNHTDVDVMDGEDCLMYYKYEYGLNDACCVLPLPYICQHNG